MVNGPRGNAIARLRMDRGGPASAKDGPGQQYTNILQFSFHQSRSVPLSFVQTQNIDVSSKDLVAPTNESNSQSNASQSLRAGKAKATCFKSERFDAYDSLPYYVEVSGFHIREPDIVQHSLCGNQANHGQYLMVLLCGLTNETTL